MKNINANLRQLGRLWRVTILRLAPLVYSCGAKESASRGSDNYPVNKQPEDHTFPTGKTINESPTILEKDRAILPNHGGEKLNQSSDIGNRTTAQVDQVYGDLLIEENQSTELFDFIFQDDRFKQALND